MQAILKEIGKIGEPSETYTTEENDKEQIVHDDCLYTDRLKLNFGEKDKCLPIMYWMPKMHKNPIGFRFIIASKNCSTKPLSKVVSKIFRLFIEQIENFHKKSKFLSGYNKFWVLKNVEPIIDLLKNVNRGGQATSISTYDFSTLYTKIPHRDLIAKLNSIIDFVFEGGGRNIIRVSKSGRAYWGARSTKYSCFSKHTLKLAVQYLIENCHFTVGNCVLRQCIGIPMGIDPAPFWANLYLYSYENDFVTNTIAQDRSRAKKFHATKRFIDDLCGINDGGEFGRSYRDIYPNELDLKLEHAGNRATFLNLDTVEPLIAATSE